MNKEIVSTNKAPAAVGPYSQATKAGGFVFVSGQIGLVPGTKEFVAGGVPEQSRQVLENLKAVLEEAGSSLDRVVKATVLLTDMADFAAVNQVYAEYFTDNPPARAAYATAGLPLGALVEIEAIALA
jgi:2-iminobutanoate/2-iminopropanoate deaminase